jgi:hypothetical protein
MPPTDRLVARFAAEPPQDGVPYGRWAERLREEFLAACLRVDADGEDLGEPQEITWYPDRTWDGRTYVPATARTSTGLELFGYVSFAPASGEDEPSDFDATAEFTDEVAEEHPEWRLDLSDHVLGGWRGEDGKVAAMTLVWGVPLGDHTRPPAIVTAELAGLTVDQCTLVDGRFALIAPDDYRGDTLEVHLWDDRGNELARESLYE